MAAKKLIEAVEKDYELVGQIKTYEISNKQYWRCFDTIIGVFFICPGLVFIVMFMGNLPRNNGTEINDSRSLRFLDGNGHRKVF